MTRMFMNSRGILKRKPPNYAATTLDLIQNLPDRMARRTAASGNRRGNEADSPYKNRADAAVPAHLDQPQIRLARRIRRWWNEGALA